MSSNDIPDNEMLQGTSPASKQEMDDLAAVRAGIADMEAGRYRPFAEVDAEFRRKHGIPVPQKGT
jgi:hypothetical protein